MKRLGRILGCLLAAVLAVASMQALAAAAGGDRGFDHAHTGFPITGLHATTPCETCHIGGVFLGTPRECDGCHAVGKRVVATPKSTSHIVTDAPCDTCHFNASTFYGARFNHGTARPGECENCHNGRIMPGKPANHPVTNYACDSCHRSSAWIPASWNHRDTVSDCSFCHKAIGPGRNLNPATHLPMTMGGVTFTNCRDCHTNYYTFLSAFYNHATAGTACQNCHGGLGGTTYTGVKQAGSTGMQSVHLDVGAGKKFATCQSCHVSYASFLGARYNHSGAAAAGCGACHDSTSNSYSGYLQLMSAAAGNIHPAATAVTIISGTTGCDTCHSTTNYSAWTGRYNHTGTAYTNQMAANGCGACHDGTHPPIRGIPSNHTYALANLIAPGTTCNQCHVSTANWRGMNHAVVSNINTSGIAPSGTLCRACHQSGGAVHFGGQELKSSSHKGMTAGQDCISCHINRFSSWNHP